MYIHMGISMVGKWNIKYEHIVPLVIRFKDYLEDAFYRASISKKIGESTYLRSIVWTLIKLCIMLPMRLTHI